MNRAQKTIGRLVAKGLSMAVKKSLSHLEARSRAEVRTAPLDARRSQPTSRKRTETPSADKPVPLADSATSAAMRASQSASTYSWASRVYNPW